MVSESRRQRNDDAKEKLAALNAPPIGKLTNLMCDMPLLNGKKERMQVSIDLDSKYVKIDTFTQGIMEYRDGVFGKIIKSGYLLENAVKQQQVVTIDDDTIKFGVKNKDGVEQTVIDRHSLLITIAGRHQPDHCSLISSLRQF